MKALTRTLPSLLCANIRSVLPKLDMIRASVDKKNIDSFAAIGRLQIIVINLLLIVFTFS